MKLKTVFNTLIGFTAAVSVLTAHVYANANVGFESCKSSMTIIEGNRITGAITDEGEYMTVREAFEFAVNLTPIWDDENQKIKIAVPLGNNEFEYLFDIPEDQTRLIDGFKMISRSYYESELKPLMDNK